MYPGGLTLHCKLPSSLADSFLQLLHGNLVCGGGYFAMSAQRGKEENCAVECSELIRNLMALRGLGGEGGSFLESFLNMANWSPDYGENH